MKLFAVISCLLAVFPAVCQLEMWQNNVQQANGDTLFQVYEGEEMPIILYTDLSVRNGGSEAEQVVVRIDKTGMYPGTQVQMCWANNCYGPAYDETPDAQTLNSGATGFFQAKYFPNDYNHGVSDVKYTFIDPAFPSDSAWIFVHYEMHSVLGVPETASGAVYTSSGLKFPEPFSGAVFDPSGKCLQIVEDEYEIALPANRLLIVRPSNTSHPIRYYRHAP